MTGVVNKTEKGYIATVSLTLLVIDKCHLQRPPEISVVVDNSIGGRFYFSSEM
jgi:hypothetical protein